MQRRTYVCVCMCIYQRDDEYDNNEDDLRKSHISTKFFSRSVLANFPHTILYKPCTRTAHAIIYIFNICECTYVIFSTLFLHFLLVRCVHFILPAISNGQKRFYYIYKYTPNLRELLKKSY